MIEPIMSNVILNNDLKQLYFNWAIFLIIKRLYVLYPLSIFQRFQRLKAISVLILRFLHRQFF